MLKPSPFLKDFAFTTLTSITIGIALVMVTRLLAKGLGPEAFGVYSLSRRIVSTLIPFSTLGMGVAVTRYIAISTDRATRYKFLVSGLILGVIPSMAIFLAGIIFRYPLSVIVFHSTDYTLVILALLFMLVGYSLYTVIYSFYRGTCEMWKANLWQLMLFALGPVIIATLYAKTGLVHLILFMTGILYFIAVVPLGVHVWEGVSSYGTAISMAEPFERLLQYSLPRIPGGLVLSGMLTLGPFLAPYFGSLTDAGYMVVGQSVFVLTESGISAFGLLVLPKAAQLYAEGRLDFLRHRIGDIIALAVHFGLFVTIQLYIWADQLILVWLGHQYINAIPIMRILLLALVPNFLYVLLRSIIDAIDEKAVNTHNLYGAMLVTIVSSLFFALVGLGILGLAVGTVFGFVTLGLTTVRYLWRGGWFTVDGFCFKECLLLNAGMLIVAFWFKAIITQLHPSTLMFLVLVFLLESVLFVLYCLIIRRLKAGWVREIEQRVIGRGIR